MDVFSMCTEQGLQGKPMSTGDGHDHGQDRNGKFQPWTRTAGQRPSQSTSDRCYLSQPSSWRVIH